MLSERALILLIYFYKWDGVRQATKPPGERPALRIVATFIAVFVVLTYAAAEAAIPEPRFKPVREAALEMPVPPPIVATGMPVPRWVTVKAARVNVRRGPSLEDDVLWTYVKPGLPVEITAEYDSWRRIRDANGEVGWVKSVMLESRRRVMFTGEANTAILSEPSAEAQAVALAAPGLIADLGGCEGEWCEVSARGYNGFVPRDRLWGVRPNDTGQ
jgi:SH3-like domain-containing protein